MSERNERKVKVGKVVSDKMDKTVVVAVVDLEQHGTGNPEGPRAAEKG